MPLGPRARVLLIAAVVFAALAAFVWYLSVRYRTQPVTPIAPPQQPEARDAATPQPAEQPAFPQTEPSATPTFQPTPDASPFATPQAQTSTPDASASINAPSTRLIVPVAGVKPQQLQDTYNDARSEGRVHNAIDIEAPRGTPVLAAADGRIIKLFKSEKGGITIYQLGTDGRTVFYYAHLDGYADGLAEGRDVRQGETIAYVGDTGNVTPGNCHLHFQVYLVSDPKKFWNGENLNPYTLLRDAK